MRGVYAKQDIKKGETLVFVPHHALIDMNMIFNSTIAQKMDESPIIKEKDFIGAEILTILLLIEKEKGKNSTYYHQINNFPDLDDFPVKYD
jgi:hypothetical protein